MLSGFNCVTLVTWNRLILCANAMVSASFSKRPLGSGEIGGVIHVRVRATRNFPAIVKMR